MPRDFFPDSAIDIVAWCKAFIRNLAPDPQAFGVPQDLFDPYVQSVSDFYAAVVQTANRGTRTRIQVIRRDALKVRVERASREIARLVLAQPGLTLEQRANFGLGDPKPRVRSAAVPDTAPSIQLSPGCDRSVNVRLLKSTSPYRGRPPGAAGALIFFQAAPRPSPGLDDWTFCEVTTRTRLSVKLPRTVAPGSVLWFKACWVNARFARGPMSTAVHTHFFDDSILPDPAKLAA